MERLRNNFRSPAIEYRPELRWWLASGHHTDETLKHEIKAAHELGFGGMEFLAMEEEGIDNERYAWGSEEWAHDSAVIVEETARRGMSELDFVFEDVICGNKRVGPVPKIDLRALSGDPDTIFKHSHVDGQTLYAVVAANVAYADGEVPVLGRNVRILNDIVQNGELDWNAPEGSGAWRLFAFWQHGTGQIATPSVSTNYTVNYLGLDGVNAVMDFWRDKILTPEMCACIRRNPRAQMYMDSLELTTIGEGGLFWGHTVPQEFHRRRGYSITPFLPFLVAKRGFMQSMSQYRYEPEADFKAEVQNARHDLVETYTDLYIDHMLRPFRSFLREYGINLRSEISYGLPFELSRPGIEVDGVETESLEFASQIDAYRLLSGVAHLFGKQYSSETGATTRNFMLPHMFYDQIINVQLAAGCTKTVLHGWASMAGAPGTRWPGYEGMYPLFSGRFDERQPGSEFYRLWCDAIGRKQFLLRQGYPRVDVGLLRTDHATDNLIFAAARTEEGYRVADEEFYGSWWMRNRQNLWWEDLGMQDAGWTYEFFDESLLLHSDVWVEGGLVQPIGPGYQALIVYQSSLSLAVAVRLLEFAEQGLKILFVHDTREVAYLSDNRWTKHKQAAVSTPGRDGRDLELKKTIDRILALPNATAIWQQSETVKALRDLGVQGRAEFTERNESILTHVREDGSLVHVFAYNFLYEKPEGTTVELTLPGIGSVHRYDVWAAKIATVPATRTESRTVVKLSLRPGESTIITLDRSQPSIDLPMPAPITMSLSLSWQLEIESWEAGDVDEIREDRGLGYTTIEHRPRTKKVNLSVGASALKPWCKVDKVGADISGIGTYSTSCRLPANFNLESSVLLDLGSTAGGLGSVSVNGSPSQGFDTAAPVVDISGLLNAGDNALVVRVSSSLNNRLKADGYYGIYPHETTLFGQWAPGDDGLRVREYGLLGPVTLVIA